MNSQQQNSNQYVNNLNDTFLEAIKNNDIDNVINLINSGLVDRSLRGDILYKEAIIWAADYDRLEILNILLQHPLVDPSIVDNQALISASGKGYVNIVRRLLQDPRVNPRARGDYACHIAVSQYYNDIANLLLQAR